jgi:hypothetical protein
MWFKPLNSSKGEEKRFVVEYLRIGKTHKAKFTSRPITTYRCDVRATESNLLYAKELCLSSLDKKLSIVSLSFSKDRMIVFSDCIMVNNPEIIYTQDTFEIKFRDPKRRVFLEASDEL